MLTPKLPADDKAEAHWARSFELMDGGVFNSEDLAICEQIQRGLGSGANERLIVGRLEQNLRRFHGSLEPRCVSGSAVGASFDLHGDALLITQRLGSDTVGLASVTCFAGEARLHVGEVGLAAIEGP